MSNKTSDINVGSIEEDVDELKSIMNLRTVSGFAYSQKNTLSLQKAIKNVLTDYTRQKQINEEHQKINGGLREKVKELEEENRIFALEGSKVRLASYIKENYIPRQKIKDKIEELKEEYDEILSEYGNLDTDVIINVPNKNVRKYLDKLVTKIQVLQELLQEEDK